MPNPAQQAAPARRFRRSIVASLIVPLVFGPVSVPAHASPDGDTRSPIKHLIVIIGENRTFDHVFATYQPTVGQSVDNLLSKRIVNADGTPGAHYERAVQRSAVDQYPDHFMLSPRQKEVYVNLPPPIVAGPRVSYIPAATPLSELQILETSIAPDYYPYLTTGGTGQAAYAAADTRVPNVLSLAPGPFQQTSSSLPYDAYANSPVHRFYQMWQQLDCSATHATETNPSGCRADLFPWVETTVGAGTNGMTQRQYATAYYAPYPFDASSTGEGGTSMSFYNMAQGDAPYLKYLADNFAMSDNYHQGVMGGTGANHIMIGMADAISFSDADFNAATPPHNVQTGSGLGNLGNLDEIENPDPMAGTNNWYAQDGYGGGSYGSPAFGGGSYSNCSDASQPGVGEIVHYLQSLPRPIDPSCEAGHYYLLNNYNPGYFPDGSNAYADTSGNNTIFTIPPSNLRHIGDALGEKGISYAYFGDQWNQYTTDKYQLFWAKVNPATGQTDEYCNICNFFQYTKSIMTSPAAIQAHLKDTVDFYADVASYTAKNNTLPAVSFLKPSGLVDGHPASSKLNLFEGFVKKVVDAVQGKPELWKDTAILVTFDEGGGYYDSGYVQPVDFFGDGTRIPMLAVSPFTRAGHISHDYTDHASIAKFIERNWKLAPLTHRSRDNLPNPQYGPKGMYAPVNGPAIGDLFDLFAFGQGGGGHND